MDMTISLVLIDDHPLFRKGLSHLLDNNAEIRVAGQFADAASLLQWLAEGGAADVALLDRNLQKSDGLDLVPDLKRHQIKVIMLTVAEEDHEIREAINRGVDGYVLKTSEPEQILRAIHAIHEGDSLFPAHVMQKMASGELMHGAFDKLSQREREIVTYVVQGMSNRAIGNALGLSENTVRNHLRSILDKLGLDNRVQVATLALKQGITKHQEP
ncbi:MAG: response regulator transcription factor [Sulfuricellaceae bacterium]|nr:response regulator transcription factor [Sulfuricellaceae bacterium]